MNVHHNPENVISLYPSADLTKADENSDNTVRCKKMHGNEALLLADAFDYFNDSLEDHGLTAYSHQSSWPYSIQPPIIMTSLSKRSPR